MESIEREPEYEFEDLSLDDALEAAKPRIRASFNEGLVIVYKDFKKAAFQITDLAEYEDKNASANWSEMGTWKTTTALWLIQQKKAKKVLVVTTRTGKVTYMQCAPSILTEHELINVQSKGFEEPTSDTVLYLAHYNLFTDRSKIRQELHKIKWDMVILDEAHRIKNPKNQWTKHLKRLTSKNRHIMTGTGFVNTPDEVWSLLNFLEPDRWTSYWSFRRRFCQEVTDYVHVRDRNGRMQRRPYKKIVGLNRTTTEQFKRILRSYGPRHTKEEVHKDLPGTYVTKIPVQLTQPQRTMYESIKNSLQLMDQQGSLLLSPSVIAALTRMRQITVGTPVVLNDYYDAFKGKRVFEVGLTEPSAKLDAMMDVLDSLEWDDERKDQIVVFTQFKDPIEMAKVRMDRAKISYIHMEQKDSDKIRAEKVEAFQQGEAQVFISTLALGAESITLTAADKIIFLDRSWSPATNLQAISRVYGRGETRTKPVQIIQIEASNTVDQKVETVLEHKHRLFRSLFG